MTEYELLVQIVSSMKPVHWYLFFDLLLLFLFISAIFNLLFDLVFLSVLDFFVIIYRYILARFSKGKKP